VASAHVVLLPIFKNPEERTKVMEFTQGLSKELTDQYYDHRKIRVEIDDRDIGGARGWEWIKKGVPVRVEIGPRDIAGNSVFVARRDLGIREKQSIPRDRFVAEITLMLDEIQKNLFSRARIYLKENTHTIDDSKTFYDYFTPKSKEQSEIHGGFSYSHWCGSGDCETKIKNDLSVTIRCIPLTDENGDNGSCICCGKKSIQRVVFAKAY
jgi:prolyl-tRNA synthetase